GFHGGDPDLRRGCARSTWPDAPSAVCQSALGANRRLCAGFSGGGFHGEQPDFHRGFARSTWPDAPSAVCHTALGGPGDGYLALLALAERRRPLLSETEPPPGHASRGSLRFGSEQGGGGNLRAALEPARQPGAGDLCSSR